MSQMMFNAMKLAPELDACRLLKMLPERQSLARIAKSVQQQPWRWTVGQDITRFMEYRRTRIAVHSNVAHVAKRYARLVQAIIYRLGRKPGLVFYTPKAFLLHRCNQLSVANQARGRIAVKRVDAKNELTQCVDLVSDLLTPGSSVARLSPAQAALQKSSAAVHKRRLSCHPAVRRASAGSGTASG